MRCLIRRSVVLAVLATAAGYAAADFVKVTIDGKEVKFDSSQPDVVDGRVLVPLRGVFEYLGATVDWDPQTQSIVATSPGHHVRLKIGSLDANVDGRVVSMDVSAKLIQDTTMVPLRFLSQSLGAKVDWRPDQNTVAIRSRGNYDEQPQSFVPTQQVTPPPQGTAPAQGPEAEGKQAPGGIVLHPDSIIPLTLDQSISSEDNHAGDRFTASVKGDKGAYGNFTAGTVVEGVVRAATAAVGTHPGTLDMRLTDLKFPDGRTFKVEGCIMLLDDKRIVRTEAGKFLIRSGLSHLASNVEPGAGAGFLVGSQKNKPKQSGVTTGVLVGTYDHETARNVTFDQGTRLALVLNKDLTIDRHLRQP